MGRIGALIRRVSTHSLARFAIVGGTAFFFEAAILHVLVHVFHIPPVPARFVSISCSMCFTWILNRFWSFAPNRAKKQVLSEALRYFAVMGTGAMTNIGVYALMLHFAPSLKYFLLFPAAVGTLAGLLVNYSGSRFIVFRAKNDPTEPAEPR